MAVLNYVESKRKAFSAVYDRVIPAGDGWMHRVAKGQTLRIVDMEGNQAVDTLFYNADDPEERYSATETLIAQGNLFLSAGTKLMSTDGNVLLEITADTCGRHDTLGGACSAESNSVRYALDKKYMHNCRDTFLKELSTCSHVDHPWGKREIAHNINFFMNVPVTPEGALTFADGVSEPGKYVEMRAETDVIVLISNCPQLNNPCNAYNPTPVRVMIWDGEDK
jgi:urea carboxylase-associated protein 1